MTGDSAPGGWLTMVLRRCFPAILGTAVLGACTAPPPCPPEPGYPVTSGGNSWIIFFDPGSTRISDHSARVLRNLAHVVNMLPDGRVHAMTHADRVGDEGANYLLSRRRGDAIREALVRLGVPPAKYTFTAYGDSTPLVPTRRGIADAQNRRAEFVVGPIPRPEWPPKGYEYQEMRCVITGRMLVPIKTP